MLVQWLQDGLQDATVMKRGFNTSPKDGLDQYAFYFHHSGHGSLILGGMRSYVGPYGKRNTAMLQ